MYTSNTNLFICLCGRLLCWELFVNTCSAHFMLGTVILLYRYCLFQPLYTCTWTNMRVTYSGQTRGWSESTLILTNDSTIAKTRLICVDQSQGLKSAKGRERGREGEIIDMKKAPLLCRAALKT